MNIYLSILIYVLSAQKNDLIERVLLSTPRICFHCETRKIFFNYALLSRDLLFYMVKLINKQQCRSLQNPVSHQGALLFIKAKHSLMLKL